MEILKLNWDTISVYCSDLSSSIRSDKYKPDVIVALSRGGLVPARLISDHLGISLIFVLGLKLYQKIGQKTDSPKITQDLNSDLSGKKVLLVDDVSDSGKSLSFAKDYLLKKGASNVRCATLHYKPGSKFKPDYFVHTTHLWICYPWEVNEVEKELSKLEK